MADAYLTQPVAVTPATGTQEASCCAAPSSVGAAPAQSAQDYRPWDIGPVAAGRGARAAGRSCKCWWVALAAVVVIAVVARGGAA